MSEFSLQVKNLRVLKNFSWTPSAFSVLVGANGSGKSTVLAVLKLIRTAYDRSLPEAVTLVLGGNRDLRSRTSEAEDFIEISIKLDDLIWKIHLTPRGTSVDWMTYESLSKDSNIIFERDLLGKTTYKTILSFDHKLIIRTIAESTLQDESVKKMANFIKNITVFHDPDIFSLKIQGSKTTEDRHLHSRGNNCLTMLRKWLQERPLKNKYKFVIDGLKNAFPGLVEDLDFQEAGQTLVARLYQPNQEIPVPLENEANGVLQMLVLLCSIAAAEPNGIVAIDEPENYLHPYAIRSLLRRAQAWATAHNIMIIFTTHSPVLLNNMSSNQIFLMRSDEHGVMPIRLDHFRDENWLAAFQIGDFYEQGEIGSNEDTA
jgi:predicted ATPase